MSGFESITSPVAPPAASRRAVLSSRAWRPLSVLAAVVVLFAGSPSARASEGRPAALRVPAGYKLAFSAQARGVQIYTSVADAGAAPRWVLEAPLAELAGPRGAIHHYAGPSWEAVDGSKIERDPGTPVVTVPAGHPAADIPWLLVKVTAEPAAGVLSRIGFVERVSTRGGVAPGMPPVRAGTKVGVPYRAAYRFYVKAN